MPPQNGGHSDADEEEEVDEDEDEDEDEDDEESDDEKNEDAIVFSAPDRALGAKTRPDFFNVRDQKRDSRFARHRDRESVSRGEDREWRAVRGNERGEIDVREFCRLLGRRWGFGERKDMWRRRSAGFDDR